METCVVFLAFVMSKKFLISLNLLLIFIICVESDAVHGASDRFCY